MVQGITKYAVLVDDPESIRYHLEKAWFLAASGRPGPCWLDIPVDVQSAMIDADRLRGYDPSADALQWDRDLIAEQCRETIRRMAAAARPVVMAGTGVRAAHALDEFRELAHRLGVPVTTAWTHDLIASDDPLFCGRPGTIGDRAGQFHRAERRCAAGARLPPEYSAGQLQLALVRARGIQDTGGRGCRRAGQAHRASGPANPLRPEDIPARNAAAIARFGVSGGGPRQLAGVVSRAPGALSRGAAQAAPAGPVQSLPFRRVSVPGAGGGRRRGLR